MIRNWSFILILGYVAACSSIIPATNNRSSDPQAVLNKTWQWVSTVTPVETIAVAAPERYTILLSDTGRLQVQFDCNSGGGNYEITPGQLSFGPLLATSMACPDDTLDYRFAQDLQRVARNEAIDVIAVPRGGHCGFLEDLGPSPWVDRLLVAELSRP